MRTNSRNILFMSLFVTCLCYSNLYNRIKQFVKFLRANYASTRISLVVHIIVVDCACRLRS